MRRLSLVVDSGGAVCWGRFLCAILGMVLHELGDIPNELREE